MKKFILPSLTAGIAMVITSFVVGQVFNSVIFPSLTSEYQNPALFRPWSDPIMSLFFLYPFALGLILAFVWSKTKQLFTGKNIYEKAARFGATYWLLTNITGMLISYSTFPVSLMMVISWSLSSLVQVVVGVIVIVWMDKR